MNFRKAKFQVNLIQPEKKHDHTWCSIGRSVKAGSVFAHSTMSISCWCMLSVTSVVVAMRYPSLVSPGDASIFVTDYCNTESVSNLYVVICQAFVGIRKHSQAFAEGEGMDETTQKEIYRRARAAGSAD